MKNLKIFVVSIGMIFAGQFVSAERRGDQGYGIMLGNPTGASFKMWMTEQVAIDGAVGVARGEFDVHATLLWHVFDWTKESKNQFLQDITSKADVPVYFGVGPRLLFEDDEEFGIRFPVGVSYLKNNSNWETFVEVAPVLRITQDVGFNADYALGVRYYFRSIRPRIGTTGN